MADNMTKLAQLIDPEVMADMISAKVPKKLVVAPFAKVDTTLQGVPGDTITVPSYGYIGDAEDVAEGWRLPRQDVHHHQDRHGEKGHEGRDPHRRGGALRLRQPRGEANGQLAKSIASKVDNDCMDALQTATLVYDGSAKAIGYAGIVDAIDLMEEEVNTEKVIFVHPKQVSVLRKDPDFLSADKYAAGVVMSGEIGKICNCRVVASKKVPVVKTGASGSQVDCYACPIVKLEQDAETEDEMPAVTIYLKRDTNVETERHTLSRTTDVSADKHYVATLSNEAKVVLAKFKK